MWVPGVVKGGRAGGGAFDVLVLEGVEGTFGFNEVSGVKHLEFEVHWEAPLLSHSQTYSDGPISSVSEGCALNDFSKGGEVVIHDLSVSVA